MKSAGDYYGPATNIWITLKNRSFVTTSLGGEKEQIKPNWKNTDIQDPIHKWKKTQINSSKENAATITNWIDVLINKWEKI